MAKNYVPSLTHAERRLRREEIAAFIRNGSTVDDACEHYNVSANTVHTACRHHGVIPPPLSASSSKVSGFKVLSEVIKATKLGLKEASYAEVASYLGVSRQYVSQCIKRANESGLIRQINHLCNGKLRLPTPGGKP